MLGIAKNQDACSDKARSGARILAPAAGAPREGELFPWFTLQNP